MEKVVVGMTMSLDGFITDHNGNLAILYSDFDEFQDTENLKESETSTGAGVMGRRAYATGNPDVYADYYDYQVPIFVLTKQTSEK